MWITFQTRMTVKTNRLILMKCSVCMWMCSFIQNTNPKIFFAIPTPTKKCHCKPNTNQTGSPQIGLLGGHNIIPQQTEGHLQPAWCVLTEGFRSSPGGAEMNASTWIQRQALFWGRRSGGDAGRVGGEDTREDGEGPGCWCERDGGRKRREKILIYGKKTEGSVIQKAFALRELLSEVRRGKRPQLTVTTVPRMSVFPSLPG